jgi:dihydroorotate dehydrogenase
MKADMLFAIGQPLLAVLDPERAHGLTVQALKLGLGGAAREADDPILATTVWNLAFPNPVGLAAGFDKHAEVCDAMLALGFGFVEAGTVTPRPQRGNSGQRLFRLSEDEAVINRFGFNSCGIAPFAGRLAKRRAIGARGIVGANLGKNRDTTDGAADYIACIEAVTGLADYLVVNISSPNTPGLRALQARAQIEDLISRVNEARRLSPVPKQPPILVKVGPDLDESEIRGIAEVALAASVDGLIVGNTTVARPSSLKSPHASAPGGLSGKPLFNLSTSCLAAMYRLTQGRIPIIGCGGIASGADAYAKIRAGASLVQLYSALVFHGPGLVGRIKGELAAKLRADGFGSVREAVGADVR